MKEATLLKMMIFLALLEIEKKDVLEELDANRQYNHCYNSLRHFIVSGIFNVLEYLSNLKT